MARDLSMAVPSREAPEGYEPRNPLESGLIRWLNAHGVSVVFAAPGSYGSMATGSEIKLNPQDGTSVLFHEAAHTYLSRLGYHSTYRYSLPENLSERGKALEYRALDQAIGRLIDIEERLRPDQRSELLSVFGGPDTGVAPLSRPRKGQTIGERTSFIQNLVDESFTLGRPREVGHPMHGFHEFFASSMATLAFDGQKFFRALNQLERLADESPRHRRAYEATLEILRAVHRLGEGMRQELAAAGVPDMHRFERNMARLGKFLELEEPQRRQAGVR